MNNDNQNIAASILLVDDDSLFRDTLNEYLQENTAYNIFFVSNGDEAKNILLNNSIDVVITDVYHPGVNGLELSEYLKKDFDTDVIILTGNQVTKREDALKAGAEVLVYKPVKFKDLLKVLNNVVKNRRR